jgi:sulfur carrier protein
MQLTINGDRKAVAATRIDAMLRELEYEGDYFAIAVNHRVVPRARWAETELKDGDAVEILTPRQGG